MTLPGPGTTPPTIQISTTWPMIFALIVAVAGSDATVIWVHVTLVYGGLKKKSKKTRDRLTALTVSTEKLFRLALKVQELITQSP